MSQDRLQRATVTNNPDGLIPLSMFGQDFAEKAADSIPSVAH